MTLKIRNYQDDDSSKLEQLLKDTGLYYKSIDKKKILKNKIEENPESIIVAEYDNKLVGTVFAIYDLWNPMIFHLGVHPDHRNKGIGSKLMDEAEKRLKARGVEEVTLFVEEENNKAMDFYKNRGWEDCGKTFCMKKKNIKKNKKSEVQIKMSIPIRNYQNNDSSKLKQLLKDIGIYYKPLDKKEIFKNKIEDNPESIIVVEDNGKLVGTVFVIYDLWNPMIFHLGVHPDHRNKGIASKLTYEAEGRLKAKGVKEVTLFVEEENNKAIDFYKKRGWEICNKNYAMAKRFKKY